MVTLDFCKQRTLFGALFFLLCIFSINANEIIPLSEIKKGMIGEWRTVVEGNELKTFRLEVLGIQPNFAGPRQAVIICKALDEEHIRSGPVAGMSGSPVYFNGKLAGAYAYGYLWPKDQAIIGITPIEKMLEVLEYRNEPESPIEVATSTASQSVEDIASTPLVNNLKKLPTPLSFSGISQDTLTSFQDQFDQFSWYPQISTNDSNRSEQSSNIEYILEPGYPIATVLMQGDFNAASVGTITWRENDYILGYGHPFNGDGTVSYPMAGAEIITIIQAAQKSFKLSNTGPVIGTVTQDRLTAIGGIIGKAPKMIPLEIALDEEVYQAQIINHPQYTPMMSAIALMEVLGSTLNKSKESTFFIEYKISIDDYPPITYQRFISGINQSKSTAISFLKQVSPLWNNRFKQPEKASITIEIQKKNSLELIRLNRVRFDRSIFKSNEPLHLILQMEKYQETDFTLSHQLTLPNSSQEKNLTLTICDSRKAALIQKKQNSSPREYNDLLQNLSAIPPSNRIHIFLTEESPGVLLEGTALSNLPPSMLQLLSSSVSNKHTPLHSSVLYHGTIEIDEVFKGSFSQKITLLP